VDRTLQLRLLGSPKISLADGSVAETLSAKAQAILYFVAVTGQPQPRAVLASLLWGDMPEADARTNLRKALANLRQNLGDYLDLDSQTVTFKPDRPYWVDVTDFVAKVGLTSPLLDIEPLQAAVDLYRGDFLSGYYVRNAPDFESWMLAEQARLRELVIQALHTVVAHYTEQGASLQGIAYARRLLALEPWREEAHRQLMGLLAQAGQRSAALAQYEICRQLLDEELGVEPGLETVALYERIRNGNLSKEREATAWGSGGDTSRIAPALPPSSPPAPLSTLPSQPTPFVGRAAELADILRRLTDRDCRLLTLVGPGGIGKTRLALRTAQAFIDTEAGEDFFAHGIIFVPLAGVSSIGGMVSAIAETANFIFYSNVPPTQQLLNYLRGKNMLLVLDNLEHLLDEGTELISKILAVAPELKILVTSREALNLQEAWFHPVEGMSFPAGDRPSFTNNDSQVGDSIASLQRYDAVQLFVQNASRARVGFSLAAEQTHVVRICQLVEGMPLGIELAAAWLKVLPAAKIVDEIERGLDILSTRLRNVPERHQSMRAVFEHSWQLLTAEEQTVFKRLSGFQGSFTQEAAVQVAEASLLSLAILVEKSLVRVTETGRYQMHELLRQFANEKLASDPQAEAVTRERHSAYYLGFLKAREAMLTGQGQRQALADIGQEIENVGIAWRWAVEQGYLAAIDQAVESLYNFYQIDSRYQEGKESFAYAITQLEASKLLAEHPESEAVLNRLYARSGGFYYFLGDYEAAQKYLEGSLKLANQPGEKTFILRMLGEVVNMQGKRSIAEAYLSQSLAISRETGHLNGVAEALRGLADVASNFGDFVAGRQLASECLAINRQLGRPVQLARALGVLAWPTNCLGGYQESEEYWQESLAICQEIGDQFGTAEGLSFLGWVAWCKGAAKLAEASAYHKKALAIYREIGHRRNLAMCLGDLTLTSSEMGENEQAIQYGREGLAVTEEIGHLDLMVYNLYSLGAAACGLGDFQTSRDYLLRSLKKAWEAQIIDHTTIALFYLAVVLTKESDRAEVTEPIKLQQKARALELVILVIHHPACWQPIKDRAARLQAQLETELPPDMTTAAQAQGKSQTLEAVVTEILKEEIAL
jgi:predicted ATPase/DNA-binding SARP family transcriptional activator